MTHPTVIKVKKNGRWIDADELKNPEPYRPPEKIPEVNPDTLPDKKELDADEPFRHLWFMNKDVRRLLTEDGKVRKGLSPEHQETARKILKRYGMEN